MTGGSALTTRAAGSALAVLLLVGAVLGPLERAAAASEAGAHDFARYPAPAMRGRFKAPIFAGDRQHRYYRTILREAAVRGPDFAGHFALVTFGCGAGCNYTMMLDGNTGRTVDFPLGGERYYELQLAYKLNSRLVKAYWAVDYRDGDICNHADFVQEGNGFRRLAGSRGTVTCPS